MLCLRIIAEISVSHARKASNFVYACVKASILGGCISIPNRAELAAYASKFLTAIRASGLLQL